LEPVLLPVQSPADHPRAEPQERQQQAPEFLPPQARLNSNGYGLGHHVPGGGGVLDR